MILALWGMNAETEEYLRAGITFCVFLLIMLLVRLFWLRILRPFAARTKTDLDNIVIVPFRSLVIWGLLIYGLKYSFVGLLATEKAQLLAAKAHGILWVVLFIWTGIRLLNGLMNWYTLQAATREEGAKDVSHQASIIRKTVNFILLVLGLLYVLKVAGVDISPLLAGGAIGGLAIALALQDTLANLFAGFYLLIDKPVSVGDFIKLESGDEGFVEEIGWRNTKVRLWANNVVVIPNQKLSQSVITNYFLPQQELSVYVWCGVAYDSDLQRVEDVTIEVAKDVMAATEGSASDWEPVVRWKEFGDFAITFVTVMRVKDFTAQYKMASDFVKALHHRFKEEDIEIPFPIRTVIMKRPPSPEMEV